MVICPDCGKEVKDAKFCSNCGSILPKSDAVKESVVEVEDTIDAKFAEKPVEEESVEEVVPDVVVEEEPVNEPVEEVVPGVTVDAKDDVKSAEESVWEEIKVETPKEEPAEVNVSKKSKFCTNCGAEIVMDAPFCPQCGFKLNQEEQQPQTKFCQSCGKKININAEICPHCGVRVAGVASSEEKSVLLAAILSFIFPGLGHIYNGLTKKGISFIIAYIVSAVLIFVLIGFILIIAVWLWALVDAIKTTEAINRGEFVEDKLF